MTERNLTAGMAAAIGAPVVRPVFLFEAEFESGTLRMWTGVGELSWNGHTWIGGGGLIGMSPVEETAEVKAAGLRVSVSGISSTNVAAVLAAARTGKPGRVYLGCIDEAGAVIATPYPFFIGRLDVPVIDAEGETATISIAYESRLIDLERPRERRYTNEDQQAQYPGDRGFEQVAGLQDLVLQL